MRALRAFVRREEGQATILAVVAFLVLTLSLFATFNIGQSVHERIRIQQHADAQAYGMGVEVARTFNYFAVTNRAIAGAYVSVMALHGYMSILSATADIYYSAGIAFFEIAAEEFALCCCAPYCPCIQHCIDGIEAIINGVTFLGDASDQDDAIKQLDGKFHTAVKMFVLMMNELHMAQLLMAQTLIGTPGYLRNGISELKNVNAPAAQDQVPAGIFALNVEHFWNAIDTKEPRQRKVMAEAVNGLRSDWIQGSRYMTPLTTLFPLLWERMPDEEEIGTGMYFAILFDSGTALTDEKGKATDPGHGIEGKGFDSQDMGMLIVQWKHGVGAMIFPFMCGTPAEVFTDGNGGDHNCGHDGSSHDEFDGVNSGDDPFGCLLSGQCFMKFNVSDDPQKEWGQPSFYSWVSQDLRLNEKGEKAGGKSFEINQNGVGITMGDGEHASVKLFDQNTAVAMSKSLVYYHRFRRSGTGESGDGWQEQPNFFHPYWRAKLHPFRSDDAVLVPAMAGNSDGAMINAATRNDILK